MDLNQPVWTMSLAIGLTCGCHAIAQTDVELSRRTDNPYADTYEDVHLFSQSEHWGPFNLHDPALLNDGEYVYCYSTDVAWGQEIEKAGVMVRRSKNLVDWEFLGWASDGRPQEGLAYVDENGGRAFEGNWAPYAIKVGDEYRLYYSQSSRVPKNSAIGLLVSSSPEGPWREAGLVVTSRRRTPGTNAIDPTVIISQEGEHWMFYGSAWDGIYALKLDPKTGLALNSNDIGVRVAQRGNTDGQINGNIEAPEIIYHPGFKKYYLFIAYDWLFTKYNVRVARADRPEGPYEDYFGNPVNTDEDNGPMILAPYRFENHPGWQGVSHCGVVERDGGYYLASQGRPANSQHSMVMHLRKMYWTQDGWPVVSPERYAGTDDRGVDTDELVGAWELIDFDYHIVPGFAEEQTAPDFGESVGIELHEDGSLTGAPWERWQYADGRITFETAEDGRTIEAIVDRAWDWENKQKTIIFTGLDPQGYPVWGKRRQVD